MLIKEEIAWTISFIHTNVNLMARLLYGSGLRLMECLRLRVKDVDFAQSRIIVRDGLKPRPPKLTGLA